MMQQFYYIIIGNVIKLDYQETKITNGQRHMTLINMPKKAHIMSSEFHTI